jgi:glycosyltransferase involved in cell wall biosynthesis
VFVNRLIQQLEDEIDLIHLHTPLVKFPQTQLPGLVTFHNPMKADSASIREINLLAMLVKLQLPVSIRLEKELLAKGNMISAVANSVAQELGDYGLDPKTVQVVGNGADMQIFHPNSSNPSFHMPQYFLTAGRLGPRKGLEDLLVCARIIKEKQPGIEFWIAGSGPYESQLKSMATSLGLDDTIRFLGHISDRQEMADLYRGAIGYVHPAHYEGLPTVLLEAMACGKPVVATAVSGALDVVEDSVNGLMVPARTPERLAEKVSMLLEDQGFAERLGCAAHETIQQRYAWPVVASNYLDLYTKIIKDAGK